MKYQPYLRQVQTLFYNVVYKLPVHTYCQYILPVHTVQTIQLCWEISEHQLCPPCFFQTQKLIIQLIIIIIRFNSRNLSQRIYVLATEEHVFEFLFKNCNIAAMPEIEQFTFALFLLEMFIKEYFFLLWEKLSNGEQIFIFQICGLLISLLLNLSAW